MSEMMINASAVTRDFSISRGMFRGKQRLKAVNGVDLNVTRGEVLALVGESGCGKTTLAKILLGLLPQTSGSISLCGTPIGEVPRLELAKTIQPIFQDTYSSLNPRKSIGSIIGLPMRVQGEEDQQAILQRVAETMELVGLPSRLLNAYPNQLSGGQRQRVAIARALVNRPQIVVCDEPTSALDVSVQSQILNLLNELRAALSSEMVADKKIAISMHKEQLAAALGEFAQRIRNRVHTATTGIVSQPNLK